MIGVFAVSVCLLAAPQGGERNERVVGVDENGWPIFESADKRDPAKPGGESVVSPGTTPAAPRVETAPDRNRGGAAAEAEPGRDARRPMGLDSPLRDVFRRVGQPADLQDLQGVIAWYRFQIRDHRGGELATREVTHEADLRFPERDRMLLPGRKVYGRDGAAVYAELHRLPMPSYEKEAAEELELFGLLLRAPWVFADDERFRLESRSHVTVGTQRYFRIELSRNPARGSIEMRDKAAARDHFELLCDAFTMDPVEIRYRLAGARTTRRMRLSRYERFGGVRVPMRRELVDDAGNASLEWTILRFDTQQQFPRAQFRPMSR